MRFFLVIELLILRLWLRSAETSPWVILFGAKADDLSLVSREHLHVEEPLPGFLLEPLFRLETQFGGILVSIVVGELASKIPKLLVDKGVETPFNSPKSKFSQGGDGNTLPSRV